MYSWSPAFSLHQQSIEDTSATLPLTHHVLIHMFSCPASVFLAALPLLLCTQLLQLGLLLQIGRCAECHSGCA